MRLNLRMRETVGRSAILTTQSARHQGYAPGHTDSDPQFQEDYLLGLGSTYPHERGRETLHNYIFYKYLRNGNHFDVVPLVTNQTNKFKSPRERLSECVTGAASEARSALVPITMLHGCTPVRGRAGCDFNAAPYPR